MRFPFLKRHDFLNRITAIALERNIHREKVMRDEEKVMREKKLL
jgi:hypothetical protein